MNKDQEQEVYEQIYLIKNFNDFVDQANEYSGVNKIARLKKTGCCFSLVQNYIKFSRQGKIEKFFLLLGYVTTHYTSEIISRHIVDANFRESDSVTSDNVLIKSLEYEDFLIQMPNDKRTFYFRELFEFIQDVSRAQSGDLKNRSKGRFAESVELRSRGRFESISGIWEDCYPMLCNKKNIGVYLKNVQLDLHRFAIISSGNHAIGFERIRDSQYLIYDPNNADRPMVLHNLNKVGESILKAFRDVGCIKDIDSGVVAISVQTVSFELDYRHLAALVSSFRAKFLNQFSWGNLANECYKIILENEETKSPLPVKASKIYELYLNQKKSEPTMNVERFIKLLPDGQKVIVRECIHIMRRAAFPEFIEKNTVINLDLNQLSAQQILFIKKMNAYLSQYHEGHLSRSDLAVNMTELISRQEQEGGLPESEDIMQLKNWLLRYLDGAVTSAGFFQALPLLDLNVYDNAGFCLVDIAFLESPNLATVRAIINHSKGLPMKFGSAKIDKICVGVLLEQACPDIVEFLIERIDMRLIINDIKILKRPIRMGNVGVVEVLVRHLPDIVVAWSIDSRSWGTSVNALSFAIKFNSARLAMVLIDAGCPLLEKDANVLLNKLPECNETAKKLWDQTIISLISSDKYEKKSTLFNQALLIPNMNIAFAILSTLRRDSLDFRDCEIRVLHRAAETGNIRIIRQIIEDNPTLVNSSDSYGQSILSKACERGDKEIVDYLLRNNAAVKDDTSSPLTFAAKAGDIEICKNLLNEGATVLDRAQISNSSLLVQQTPLAGLMLSNLKTARKKEIFMTLFANCEDMLSASIVNIAYEAIVTASQSELTTKQDIKMMVALFRIDWSVNTSKDGINLAMLSLESNNIPLVRFFLKKARINRYDCHSEKGTLLCMLIEKIREQEQTIANNPHHFDDSMLRALIDIAIEMIHNFPQLIDIQRPCDGNSPLMLATYLISTTVIAELIEAGAKFDLINKRGCTVLHCAVISMNQELVVQCLERNPNLCVIKDCDGCTPMHYLARQVTTFDQILRLCGNQPLNVTDNAGRNILHFAIQNSGNVDLVRTLLQREFDPIKLQPEVVSLEEIQESALTIAVTCQNFRGIVAILEYLPPLQSASIVTLSTLLEPFRNKIFTWIKAKVAQAVINSRTREEGMSIALVRLDRILHTNIIEFSRKECAEFDKIRQSLQPQKDASAVQSMQQGYK